jgi:hypothetical protein
MTKEQKTAAELAAMIEEKIGRRGGSRLCATILSTAGMQPLLRERIIFFSCKLTLIGFLTFFVTATN